MRVIGLEPTHLAAPDPKSGVSTNFTTPAMIDFSFLESANIHIYCLFQTIFLKNVFLRQMSVFGKAIFRIFDP